MMVLAKGSMSGLHCGELQSFDGVLRMKNHRRIWYHTRYDDSDLVLIGPNAEDCLSVTIPSIILTDIASINVIAPDMCERFRQSGWKEAIGFAEPPSSVEGEYCLVKEHNGIFAGVVKEYFPPRGVVLSESRKIEGWQSQNTPNQKRFTLNEVASWGLVDGSGSKLGDTSDTDLDLYSALEIIPVSKEAESLLRTYRNPDE